MSKENDEFVENLLKGFPKAEPISEFELRQFEKMIDRQADDYKRSHKPSRLKLPTSIAASIAIVFGAVFVLTNQSPVTEPTGSVTESASPASPEESSNSNSTAPQVSPAPSQSNSTGEAEGSGSQSGLFGNNESLGNEVGTVAGFNSNLDYLTDKDRIAKVVIIASTPGNMSSLQNKAQQCAIKLGVSKSLLAYDSGYFQGQRTHAYYSGKNKNDYKIILVDSDCNVLSEL
jgi:hypothetical protein